MSRAKGQRPKTRAGTQSEKRARAASAAGDPYEGVEHAIDALDQDVDVSFEAAAKKPGPPKPPGKGSGRADSLPPIPQRPDRKPSAAASPPNPARRPGRAATPLPLKRQPSIEIEIDTSSIEREDPEEIGDDDIADEEVLGGDDAEPYPAGGLDAALDIPDDDDRDEPDHDDEPDDELDQPAPPPAPLPAPRPPSYAEFGMSGDAAEISVKKRMPLPERPPSVDDDDDLGLADEEVPQLPALAIAVYDTAAMLASAESVIAEAGHGVAIAASGPTGLERVAAAIRGGVDAMLVVIPGGEALIDVAYAAEHRPVIIASVAGAPDAAVARAIEVGADLVALRPHELVHMAPVLLAATRLAKPLEDDDEPGGTMQAYDQFVRTVEQAIVRALEHGYPLSLALFALEIPAAPPPGVPGILRARTGNALVHAMRDIDIATEMDHERFLVLMPYTSLTAATAAARKMIAAVAAGDAVVMAGRQFAPRVIGAVTGAEPGQPLALARFLREVSDALDQARRDGAELAVRP